MQRRIYYKEFNLIMQTGIKPKKNILKTNSFDVMQTVFFAFTYRFGLVY